MPHYGSPQLVDWSNPISDHPLNDGLVAWWMAVPGRQGWKTTAWRDLRDGAAGTLVNMARASDWVAKPASHIYGALDFDGANDVVRLGSASESKLTGRTSFAVEFLFRPDTLGTDERIYNHYDSGSADTFVATDFLYTQDIRLVVNDPSGNTLDMRTNDTPLATNSWIHAVVSWNGGNAARIYTNGVQRSTTTSGANNPSQVRSSNGEASIGGRWTTSADKVMDGRLAFVKLHGQSVGKAKAAALYQQSMSFYPNLLNRSTRRTTVYVPAAGGSQYSDIFGSTIFGGSVIA